MYILKQYTEKYCMGIFIFTHNETISIKHLKFLKEKYYFIQHLNANSYFSRNKLIDLHLMPKFNVNKENDIPIATNVLINKCFTNYKENSKNNFITLLKKYNIDHMDYSNDSNGKRIIDLLYGGRIVHHKKTIDVLTYFTDVAQLKKKCIFLLLERKE